ncbi:hypothetical protein GBAR_LOCUS20904, partial [Geodia barretti]
MLAAERQTESRNVIIRHVAQSVGDASGQKVAAEVQFLQVGEVQQFRRYRPRQPVVTEVQRLQVGEAPQLFRYIPIQTHATKEDFGHTSRRFTEGNTGPIRDRSVRRPVERRGPRKRVPRRQQHPAIRY